VVFQFTPLSFGSDAFDHHDYKSDAGRKFTLSRVISISSAAFDGSNLESGPSQSLFWSALNQDSGMYVHNPNLERSRRELNRLKIWPFYYINHYRRDIEGSDIYLSDGGHSENLGVYSLVQRGCNRIIIVDAEHDPTYIFESYRDLQRGLRSEMGTTLWVDDIEKAIQESLATRSAGTNTSQLSVLDRQIWRDVAEKPVVEGWIAGLPFDPAIPKNDRVHILYIKMAYWHNEMTKENPRWEERLAKKLCTDDTRRPSPDCAAFRNRQKTLHAVFDTDKSNSCPYDSRTLMYDGVSVFAGICPFPHRATKNQTFTADEYDAWRNLGRVLVDAHSDCIERFVKGLHCG